MKEEKMCKKKLTEAGGGVCLLAFTAALISAMGLLMEFLGLQGYNRFSDVAQTYVFAPNIYDYIFTYDKSIITFLLSFTVFCIVLACRRKKKIGAELPAILIISSVACSVKPVTFLAYALNNKEFLDLFSNGGDSRTFLAVMTMLIYVLPLFSCFFLLICGLVLAFKLAGESFKADVPYMKFEEIINEEKKTEAENLKSAKENSEEVVPDFEFVNSNYMPNDKTDSETNPVEENHDDLIEETEVKKCPYCGEQLKPDAKFCQSCGGKVI